MNMPRQIEETAEKLIPLYAREEADLPDRPLWEHPEIVQVIEALRILSDVLFPGRHVPEPADFRRFFIQQLQQTAEILGHEISKALPFRWMGAADLHENRPPIENLSAAAMEIVNTFIQTVPDIRRMLIEDVKAAYNGDPAALSYAEVKLAYPGLIAITSHRKRRDKAGIASRLDAIPGVGPSRRKALLTHFGSLEAIQQADIEALKAVPGIPAAVAEAIKSHLE